MWTARLAECPVCRRGFAVRPLTGNLWRHGEGVPCPGSDKLPDDPR
jgi:hypothetical protein